jgi:hypothetical protein
VLIVFNGGSKIYGVQTAAFNPWIGRNATAAAEMIDVYYWQTSFF